MKITYLDKYHYFNETIMPLNPAVVHVGIQDFDVLKKVKELYPNAYLKAVEADPDSFKAHKAEAKKLDIDFHNKALGSGKKMTLNRFKNRASNSVFDRHEYDTTCELVDSVEVPTITWSQLGSGDLLVLNCEGGELYYLNMIVKDLDTRCNFDQICVSFHNPRIYPTEIREKLLEQLESHFHIVVNPHPTWMPDVLLIKKKG